MSLVNPCLADQRTIAAIATPAGQGGIGIVRISGPSAKQIGQRLTGKVLRHRRVVFANFVTVDGQTIDFGYVLYFKAPYSFTGEEVVELHGHGGTVVMDNLLTAVLAQGAEMAEPGEFSRQAFLNGKLDLTQAEAIADVIEANSQQALRMAQRSLQGEFSQEVSSLTEDLMHLRVTIESLLDFPDEEIDAADYAQLSSAVCSLSQKITRLFRRATQAVQVQEGLTIALVGEPNVGKSTLLNLLSGEQTAIVTPIAGTTRDLIRTSIVIDGVVCHVIDTAGLRETTDLVELEGIRRTRTAMQQADLVLHLVEALPATSIDSDLPSRTLIVVNKIDRLASHQSQPRRTAEAVFISAKERMGVELLKETILTEAGIDKSLLEGTFSARRRHLSALSHVQTALLRCQQQLQVQVCMALAAEELRVAQHYLGEITGKVTADRLLGEIFSTFCIGK